MIFCVYCIWAYNCLPRLRCSEYFKHQATQPKPVVCVTRDKLTYIYPEVVWHPEALAFYTCIDQQQIFLQSFDSVGWVTGRASGMYKKLHVGLSVVTFWLELCTSYSSSCHYSPPLSPSVRGGSKAEAWGPNPSEISAPLQKKVQGKAATCQKFLHYILTNEFVCVYVFIIWYNRLHTQ